MNKEQIQQAAKEFCEVYGKGLYNHPGTIGMAVNFLQSMIDKGEVFSKKNSKGEDLTNYFQCIESTDSSAGKEVKTLQDISDDDMIELAQIVFGYNIHLYQDKEELTADALEEGRGIIKKLENNEWISFTLPVMVNVVDFLRSKGYDIPNQFEASSAKEISDQEIEQKAKEISEPFGSRYKACLEMVKWYREQLEKKS